MLAAGNQAGQIQHILTSITGEAHPQPSLTAWLGLFHHWDVADHSVHLWNSFHNCSNSVRCSSSQRRVSLSTLLGTSPAISSPFDKRIFAAKSGPLMWTWGGFSSWKNIRSLKPLKRLISGIKTPNPPYTYRAFFALSQVRATRTDGESEWLPKSRSGRSASTFAVYSGVSKLT